MLSREVQMYLGVWLGGRGLRTHTSEMEQLELESEGPVTFLGNSELSTIYHLPQKRALQHFNYVLSNQTP